jgi:hypothetical protein
MWRLGFVTVKGYFEFRFWRTRRGSPAPEVKKPQISGDIRASHRVVFEGEGGLKPGVLPGANSRGRHRKWVHFLADKNH